MTLVETFVTKVIAESTFEELDRIYLTNRVLALAGDGALEVKTDHDSLHFPYRADIEDSY